jgi:MacB-like periplasmic core domain
MITLRQKLRQGLRMVGQRPGWMGVALIAVASGIGSQASFFARVERGMLKPLSALHPECLTTVGKERDAGAVMSVRGGSADLFSYTFYKKLQGKNEAFQELCAFQSFTDTVSVTSESTRAAGQARTRLVSGNYFAVFGVRAMLGRTFTAADESGSGSNPVAVLSYQFWQERFSGDRGVVGKTIALNGVGFMVIGITPPGFSGESSAENPPQVWLPLTVQPQMNLYPSFLGPNGPFWLRMTGRLQPGWSQERAEAWVAARLQDYLSGKDQTTLGENQRATALGPA